MKPDRFSSFDAIVVQHTHSTIGHSSAAQQIRTLAFISYLCVHFVVAYSLARLFCAKKKNEYASNCVFSSWNSISGEITERKTHGQCAKWSIHTGVMRVYFACWRYLCFSLCVCVRFVSFRQTDIYKAYLGLRNCLKTLQQRKKNNQRTKVPNSVCKDVATQMHCTTKSKYMQTT